MDKEQQKRMANRTIVEENENIEFTVQVSGDQVELHRSYEQPWDNEHGTGPDISHEVWTMSLDTLKRFLTAARWCVEKSEAFEAAHPVETENLHQESYEEIATHIQEMSQSAEPDDLS